MFRKNARNARIRRHARRHPALTAVAGFVAAALAVAVVQHLVILVLLAVAGAGGYVLARNRRASTRAGRGPRPAARRGQAPTAAEARRNGLSPERWETIPQGDVISPAAPFTQQQPASKFQQRARSNGWVPPASPELVTMALSPQCRDLDCVSCPGGRCECPACRHSPDRVVAVSNALYDAAQAEPVPPF
jgi:hypothetical protein